MRVLKRIRFILSKKRAKRVLKQIETLRISSTEVISRSHLIRSGFRVESIGLDSVYYLDQTPVCREVYMERCGVFNIRGEYSRRPVRSKNDLVKELCVIFNIKQDGKRWKDAFIRGVGLN